MIERFEPKLLGLFGPMPVVREYARVEPPYLMVVTTTGGDPYSGTTTNEDLRLELERPSTGLLRIEFFYVLHELSGQCDHWALKVSGAAEAERETFKALFHPSQEQHSWSPNAPCTFTFNGAVAAFR